MFYEDFRAHVRARHGMREFDDKDLPMYEAWPGSSRYIQRRPARQPARSPSFGNQNNGRDGNFHDLIHMVTQTVTQSVFAGIEQGMKAVMQSFGDRSGKYYLFSTFIIRMVLFWCCFH